jgi:hypothetical protein
MMNAARKIEIHRVPHGVWAFGSLIGISIGGLTILRHQYFLTATYDMGFYVHDVWRIAHGEWTNTIFGFHVFADHFSPIMILLAPLAFLDTSTGLLVVQALAVGSTVIPAFRLGKKLGGESLGWVVALWVGLSASVWHTVFYDFRPATLGFVALMWLVAEVETGRRTWLVYLLAALAASSREDVAIFTGIALLIQAYITSDRALAWPGLIAASVGVWYTTMGQRLFAPFDYFMWYRYADYGSGPLDAVLNPAYALPTAVERLGRPDVLVAFAALLVPLMILPAWGGWRRSWPGLLIMAGNGVSGAPFIPTIHYQYYILAVVFLVWGAAHFVADRGWEKWSRVFWVVTVGVFLLAGPILAYTSTPFGRSVADIAEVGGRAVLQEELPRIPVEDSVSAGNVLLPHLAERDQIFSYPLPLMCGEVIQRYTPQTAFPEWVIIQPEEQEEIDLPTLGYERIDDGGRVAVWRLREATTQSEPCPPPSVLKQNLFERVRSTAGRS